MNCPCPYCRANIDAPPYRFTSYDEPSPDDAMRAALAHAERKVRKADEIVKWWNLSRYGCGHSGKQAGMVCARCLACVREAVEEYEEMR